ncbi:MAG: outer membrane beta-barrel protein [Microvirga sp.]
MRILLQSLLAGAAVVALAASAQAADLPSRAAPAPMIAAVPLFTWTGFYIGVNAGYGWNNNDSNSTYYDPTIAYYGANSDEDGGFVGGGQVGYNYQVGSFVIGVEADLQYADIGGKSNGYYAGYYAGDKNSDGYLGTVRARVGVAFDRALIYATGGFAYGDVASGSSTVYAPGTFYYGGSSDDTNTGWTLGGGVEYAFTDNLTAKVEGLYVNLDTKSNYTGLYADSNNAEFGIIRAGLNFKFSSY